MEELFTNIYKKNIWGGGSGTANGGGSSPRYCEQYLAYLRGIIPGKVVLDLGCGDWQLYDGFDWSVAKSYVGVDVVAYLIEGLADRFHDNTSILFDHADFSNPETFVKLTEFYKPDLVLVKDVFHHWTTEEIERWLAVLPRAHWTTLLVASDWKHFRSPEKNAQPRQSLDNKYHWAPIDLLPLGFEHVLFYPRGKFKRLVKMEK